jgi:hypothetical protein
LFKIAVSARAKRGLKRLSLFGGAQCVPPNRLSRYLSLEISPQNNPILSKREALYHGGDLTFRYYVACPKPL